MAYGDDIFARQMEARRLYGTGLGDLAPYINKSTDILAQGFQEAQKMPLATAQLEAELYGKRSAMEMERAKLAAEAEARKEARRMEQERLNLMKAQLGEKQKEQGRHEKEAARRDAQAVSGALTDVSNEIQERYLKQRGEVDTLKMQLEMGQLDNSAAQKILSTAIAKGPAGLGPVLTDNDVKMFMPGSAIQSVKDLYNYVTANDVQTLPPNIKQNLMNLLATSIRRRESQIDQNIKKDLPEILSRKAPFIIDDDGTINPHAQTMMKQYGVQGVVKDGRIAVVPVGGSGSTMIASEQEVLNKYPFLSEIADPTLRKRAIDMAMSGRAPKKDVLIQKGIIPPKATAQGGR